MAVALPSLIERQKMNLLQRLEQHTIAAASIPPVKRIRADLLISQKRIICDWKEENPKLTQLEIQRRIESVWGVRLGLSTISEILKDKNKWRSLPNCIGSIKRARKGKHAELEDCLFTWLCDALVERNRVSGDMLCFQARRFGSLLGLDEFSYSKGWLSRFKKRYGVRFIKINGEQTPFVDCVVTSTKHLLDVLERYTAENIFVCLHCVLYCNALPYPVDVKEEFDNKFTVSLCTNVLGTKKLAPLVVGRRTLDEPLNESTIVYQQSETGSITALQFDQWLKTFNHMIGKAKEPPVFFLVDHSSHQASFHLMLPYIKMHKLTLKTSCDLQEFFSSLILHFKGHYRRLQLESLKSKTFLSFQQMLEMISQAWNEVSHHVISNLWNKTVLSEYNCDITEDEKAILNEVQKLINETNETKTAMSASEFIFIDFYYTNMYDLTEEDIVDLVLSKEAVETSPETVLVTPDAEVNGNSFVISSDKELNATSFINHLIMTTGNSENTDQMSCSNDLNSLFITAESTPKVKHRSSRKKAHQNKEEDCDESITPDLAPESLMICSMEEEAQPQSTGYEDKELKKKDSLTIVSANEALTSLKTVIQYLTTRPNVPPSDMESLLNVYKLIYRQCSEEKS